MDNKQELNEILQKYDKTVAKLYYAIVNIEGNQTLTESEKKDKISKLILDEANKNVD